MNQSGCMCSTLDPKTMWNSFISFEAASDTYSSYTQDGLEYYSVLSLCVNLEQYFSHDTQAFFQ